MKVDVSKSRYREREDARTEFNRTELRRLRLMLRRLRFLEAQVRETGDSGKATGGAVFAEWEIEALEWLLHEEMGFLDKPRTEAEVVGSV